MGTHSFLSRTKPTTVYDELMSDAINPTTAGTYKKLVCHITSVTCARDSLEPGKMGNKPGQTIDTKDMDPQELKSFHTLLLESIGAVKNIAQAYPNSKNDSMKYLKYVPDLVSSFRKMRDFVIIRSEQSDLSQDSTYKGKKYTY